MARVFAVGVLAALGATAMLASSGAADLEGQTADLSIPVKLAP